MYELRITNSQLIITTVGLYNQ